MPTQILATGNTGLDSSDLVVTDAPVTVSLKGQSAGGAQVVIKLKDDAGEYNAVGLMTSSDPAVCITAPGTYRFTRIAGGACGVFRG